MSEGGAINPTSPSTREAGIDNNETMQFEIPTLTIDVEPDAPQQGGAAAAESSSSSCQPPPTTAQGSGTVTAERNDDDDDCSTSSSDVPTEPPGPCLACAKAPMEYETASCHHRVFCRRCAMKCATGGKCKVCGQMFPSLKKIFI